MGQPMMDGPRTPPPSSSFVLFLVCVLERMSGSLGTPSGSGRGGKLVRGMRSQPAALDSNTRKTLGLFSPLLEMLSFLLFLFFFLFFYWGMIFFEEKVRILPRSQH